MVVYDEGMEGWCMMRGWKVVYDEGGCGRVVYDEGVWMMRGWKRGEELN